MSDPDAAPDPMDQAYVQAEAVLRDEGARAARRARVLAAVARERITPAAASSPPARLPARRQVGWLAAAAVVGLGVFVATRLYQPAPRQSQTASRPGAPPTLTVPNIVAAPTWTGPARSEASERRALPTAPRPPMPAPARLSRDAPSGLRKQPTLLPATRGLAFPPAAPPAAVAGLERSAPAPAANYAHGLRAGAAPDEPVNAQSLAPLTAKPASIPAVARPLAATPLNRLESSAPLPSNEAARLRAAAAAGRTAEMEALLAQGIPVDAPDADGETALMKSIQADQPAAAAMLRRYGARLDRRNHAGERARDMATARGDAGLNRAIGLGP